MKIKHVLLHIFLICIAGNSSCILPCTLSSLPTATFEYGNTIQSVDWQQIGSSYYIAMGGQTVTGPEINVFRFDPAASTLITLPTATFEYNAFIQSVAWQQINSSYYLATGGSTVSGPEINVLLFNPSDNSLTLLPGATFEYGNFVQSVDWQQVGSNYYLALCGEPISGPEVQVLQFNPTANTLNILPTATIEFAGSALSVAWQSINSTYYLAVGGVTAGANIQTLQFNPTTSVLSSLPSATFDNGSSGDSVAWLSIGSSHYLAFGGSSGIATLLQFDPATGILSALTSATFNYGAFINEIAWQNINSTYYLAIGGAPSSNIEVQVIQFDPTTVLFSELPTATFDNGINVYSVAWQQIGSTAYLATGGMHVSGDPNLRVLQFGACSAPTPSSSCNTPFCSALIAKYHSRVT